MKSIRILLSLLPSYWNPGVLVQSIVRVQEADCKQAVPTPLDFAWCHMRDRVTEVVITADRRTFRSSRVHPARVSGADLSKAQAHRDEEEEDGPEY